MRAACGRGAAPALPPTPTDIPLAEGWDVEVVAQLLGRASVSTTSEYLDELPRGAVRGRQRHPLPRP